MSEPWLTFHSAPSMRVANKLQGEVIIKNTVNKRGPDSFISILKMPHLHTTILETVSNTIDIVHRLKAPLKCFQRSSLTRWLRWWNSTNIARRHTLEIGIFLVLLFRAGASFVARIRVKWEGSYCTGRCAAPDRPKEQSLFPWAMARRPLSSDTQWPIHLTLFGVAFYRMQRVRKTNGCRC